MNRFLLTIITIAISFPLSAQRVFKGNSTYTSDIICNLQDGKVYKGASRYSSDILLNIDGNRIYKGASRYSSDIVCTLKDNKIYRGASIYSSDVVFTIKDSKVYKKLHLFKRHHCQHQEWQSLSWQLILQQRCPVRDRQRDYDGGICCNILDCKLYMVTAFLHINLDTHYSILHTLCKQYIIFY